jgi:predicted RNase H-like HicB family nuclease
MESLRKEDMMQIYPAIFTETKDEKETVLVYIPDINGMTEGYGIYDAFSMAKDYIGNYLCTKADSSFPVPTPIEEVVPGSSVFASAGKSSVFLVDVDVDSFRRRNKSRYVRRNITLPEWLDEMAVSEKINVSEVTQNALKQRLGLST